MIRNLYLSLTIIICLPVLIAGCGDSKEAARKQLQEKISIEDFCKLQKEIVDIGMMNYYDLIKNKKTTDAVKELEKYRKEVDTVLKKHDLDLKTLINYKRVFNREIENYLSRNPEMNWNASPEQMEFNNLFSGFLKRSLGLK